MLNLGCNQLTNLPAEIGQLTSLSGCTQLQSADELAGGDRAARVAEAFVLSNNKLTSLPAEIWQLTSLRDLYLSDNRLTSLPAEIGQLTSLESCTSAAIS